MTISTEQGAFPQQLEHEGIGHIVGSIGEIVGPTAFSSLVARWDSLDSDVVKAVARAYRASREWVNKADPMEVAEAEEPFFPGWRWRLLLPRLVITKSWGIGTAISLFRGICTSRRWMCSSIRVWLGRVMRMRMLWLRRRAISLDGRVQVPMGG